MERVDRQPGFYGLRWVLTIPFFLVHLFCFAAIWTGVAWSDVALCVALYWIRMFGISAGYHRYFSHKTYQMGRLSQFLMAFLAQTSAQKGVLWWAAHHRDHHRYSDQPADIHSVKQQGFWYAHVGWILTNATERTKWEKIKDFGRFPELRWLNQYHLFPPVLLGFAVWLFAGWSGLVVGFLWSTVLLWHGTFTVNSLAHLFGPRRYETADDSRNCWPLFFVTLGECWHNNHHQYQASVRQGFYWWEVDITYYVLWAMSKVGIVRKMRKVPLHVLENRPRTSAPRREEPARAA